MPIKGRKHPGSVRMLRKYEKIQDDRKAHRKQMICLTGTFGFPDRKKQSNLDMRWTVLCFFYEDLMKLMMGRICMFSLLTLSIQNNNYFEPFPHFFHFSGFF